jgi:hypothetical protein
MWLQEISKYFTNGKFLVQYNHEQKKKLALRALHFFWFNENYIVKVKTKFAFRIQKSP